MLLLLLCGAGWRPIAGLGKKRDQMADGTSPPKWLCPRRTKTRAPSPEIADTKPQADHAQSRLMARHCLRMKVFDPLVSVEPSAQARLRGWAVAAAIIAQLQEVGLSGGIDAPAILGPAISELSEADLEELARQLNGPLTDPPDTLLGDNVRARQLWPNRRPTRDLET
jgi:hypothetical protein